MTRKTAITLGVMVLCDTGITVLSHFEKTRGVSFLWESPFILVMIACFVVLSLEWRRW